MPIQIERRRKPRKLGVDWALNRIDIGLVNNMPDTALEATERQYLALLGEAAQDVLIHLHLFTLPEIRRGDRVAQHMKKMYRRVDALAHTPLDGLIVTGAEPRAPTLDAEPSWPTVVRLAEWAESRTISTLWSCLAAHSVVYHFDGIARRPLPGKLSGVFACAAAQPHALVDGLPPTWCVPHSRYNELPEEQLLPRGYRILARSRDAGADTIIKEGAALHVFLQGHPEYDWSALAREYRRDVRRYLIGDGDEYPALPYGYFPPRIAAEMLAFRERAMARRRPELLNDFPLATRPAGGAAPWADAATRFFANWFGYIAARKYADVGARAAPAFALG